MCVFRVLRVLHVVPPHCHWGRDVTFFPFCSSYPRKPKVKISNKGPARPRKAPQRVRGSRQGAKVVRQVTSCMLWCHCRLHVLPVWCCCASEFRLDVCRAFCAFYVSYPS